MPSKVKNRKIRGQNLAPPNKYYNIQKYMSSEYKVYGARWCKTCEQVKLFLEEEGFTYKYVDIGNKDDAKLFIKQLQNNHHIESSWKTIPMVFHHDKFIGGYSHTRIYVNKLIQS